MILTPDIKPPTTWNGATVALKNADGEIVLLLRPMATGFRTLTDAETIAISEAIVSALGASVEVPDAKDDYRCGVPAWASIATGSTPATRASRSAGPAVSAEDVKRGPDGEIVVPPRKKDETPEEKRLRRALRRMRNIERESKNK